VCGSHRGGYPDEVPGALAAMVYERPVPVLVPVVVLRRESEELRGAPAGVCAGLLDECAPGGVHDRGLVEPSDEHAGEELVAAASRVAAGNRGVPPAALRARGCWKLWRRRQPRPSR
jgi:hypothetical protein